MSIVSADEIGFAKEAKHTLVEVIQHRWNHALHASEGFLCGGRHICRVCGQLKSNVLDGWVMEAGKGNGWWVDEATSDKAVPWCSNQAVALSSARSMKYGFHQMKAI